MWHKVARWQTLILPFLGLRQDGRGGGAIQGKEGIKFCHLATLIYRSIHARHTAAPRAKGVHLVHAPHLRHAALLVRTHGQRGRKDVERGQWWEEKSQSWQIPMTNLAHVGKYGIYSFKSWVLGSNILKICYTVH